MRLGCDMPVKWGPPIEGFDCVKWTRETRDRIYEETKDMSFEEQRAWSHARIRRDPGLAAILDRIVAPGAVPPRPDPEAATNAKASDDE